MVNPFWWSNNWQSKKGFLKFAKRWFLRNLFVDPKMVSYSKKMFVKTCLLIQTCFNPFVSEAGVPFFSISASEFVEIFAGIGASRVRDLFEQAKKCLGAVEQSRRWGDEFHGLYHVKKLGKTTEKNMFHLKLGDPLGRQKHALEHQNCFNKKKLKNISSIKCFFSGNVGCPDMSRLSLLTLIVTKGYFARMSPKMKLDEQQMRDIKRLFAGRFMSGSLWIL